MLNENKYKGGAIGAFSQIDIMSPICKMCPICPTGPTGETGPTGPTGETGPVGGLTLIKSTCKCIACVGEEIPYTLKITNTGLGTINSIQVSDILPSWIYVSSYISSKGTMLKNDGTITWQVSSLAPGESAVATIVLIATDMICGCNPYIINVAQVTSYNGLTNIPLIKDIAITHIDCFCCNCKK